MIPPPAQRAMSVITQALSAATNNGPTTTGGTPLLPLLNDVGSGAGERCSCE